MISYQNLTTLASLIFFLPVAAFVVMALFHNRLKQSGDWLACGTLSVSLCLSLLIFANAWELPGEILVNKHFSWLPLGAGKALNGGILVDSLTAVMLVVVTLVSFLVHLFSSKYMEGDIRYGRYYCSLLLFTSSMLGLVLVNNLLYLFIFWELVGLSSYILIGHWYEKKSASNAAIKAFITTRVGDVGMFLGILICYISAGSLDYAQVFAAVADGRLSGSWQTLAGLGIFFGAMGKSAQFPLHVWLPDAMEGPTPVSALIHAATMVAAGVYLTGRMLPMFDPTTLLFIAYIGGGTALFAATIAVVQDDIKKVLAYSTVSQLGYMTLALGVGGYTSGLFHLTTHAFFKACLFLGSGAVIHAMHHEQSLSKYGGLAKKMPITAVCYALATLALVGFPGFAGFWSKDAILADTLAFCLERGHWFLALAAFTTVFLTAFYMCRQYLLTFLGAPRDHHRYEHAHEVPWQMLAPLVILGFLSVVGGGSGGWFKELNPKLTLDQHLSQYHFPPSIVREAVNEERIELDRRSHASEEEEHFAHESAMGASTVLGLMGLFVGALFYFQRKDKGSILNPGRVASNLPRLHNLLLHKYYVDELYEVLFLRPFHALAGWSARFDRGIIDGVVNKLAAFGKKGSDVVEVADRIVIDMLIVLGIARTSYRAGESLSTVQNGYLRSYLKYTLVGLVSILLVISTMTVMYLYSVAG